jgi:hypothetical protein
MAGPSQVKPGNDDSVQVESALNLEHASLVNSGTCPLGPDRGGSSHDLRVRTVSRADARFSLFVIRQRVGPGLGVQFESAFVHMAPVVAVLRAYQVRIGSQKGVPICAFTASILTEQPRFIRRQPEPIEVLWKSAPVS